MSSTSDDPLNERKFVLIKIEKTDPPDGESTGTWYQYIIGHASSTIKGVRAGSKKSVKEYAEEFAENLNRRALAGYSSYAARKPQNKE